MANAAEDEMRPLGDYRGRPVAVDLSGFKITGGDKELTESLMLTPRVIFEDITVAMRLRVARHTFKTEDDSECVGLVQVFKPTVVAEVADSKVAKELDAAAAAIDAARQSPGQGTLSVIEP